MRFIWILLFILLCRFILSHHLFFILFLEEAASVLGKDEILLARVMEWCDAKDHAGVRGEANRLLAALIRHSRNPVSIKETHKEVYSVMHTRSKWSRHPWLKSFIKIFPSDVFQEVIQTVIKVDGVQHLISMAISEHVIMQNEALVALAIASAIDIGKITWRIVNSLDLFGIRLV